MSKHLFFLLFSFFSISFWGCNNSTKQEHSMGEMDHSFSNFDKVVCLHLNWTARVDFDSKKIIAKAEWKFKNLSNSNELLLDINDIKVFSVLINNSEVAYHIIDKKSNQGNVLQIPIAEKDSIVIINYETGKNATALQWLEPSQTAGKKMPYLFTQCESINARSLVPCQDAPAVRITYTADITVPKGMMAVMSAKNPTLKNANGFYHFDMELAIPSYLIALAVGDIEYKAIDEKCGVYTEPIMLEKCAKEFVDIPRMIVAAEKLAGPYAWGKYDVLVAPPSFPIGGMENPRLTFATPTIIAGDKSLVALIAHELAHSWSGNLVTNSNWNDLWLNEGFTTYFERRIMEEISGKDFSDMNWEIGFQDLQSDLNSFGATHDFTKLKVDLKNHEPEDAFSNIPYEKGALFLKTLEHAVGRTVFDKWLVSYFNAHRFMPMNTKMCEDFMTKNLTIDKSKIDIRQWIHEPGLPKNYTYNFPLLFKKVDSVREQFIKTGAIDKNVKNSWSTNEWLHFLRKLPRPLDLNKIKTLESNFNFTKSGNYEIACEWFLTCIASEYKNADAQIFTFLSTVGRKKFLEPLYTEILKSKDGKMKATFIFDKVKQNYHPLTAKKIESVINK